MVMKLPRVSLDLHTLLIRLLPFNEMFDVGQIASNGPFLTVHGS